MTKIAWEAIFLPVSLSIPQQRSPPSSAWPPDGLESVARCPVCGSHQREPLHENLQDRVFFCAPGKWTLQRCLSCGSGFLDPRPNLATISEAYRDYYTHGQVPSEPMVPRGLRRKFRLALRNGYLNDRFGCHFAPASALGPVFYSHYSAARRHEADRWVRNLYFPKGPPRLLDLGCGNGHFLVEMRACGWEVYGSEPDVRAVEACRKVGLQVQLGMLAEDTFSPGFFAAITLNHVIEHLHDPLATLRLCFKFLQPGGTLWIATPNLKALGHTRFGRNWFALDPPRHLILFTPASLRGALEQAGLEVAPRLLRGGGAKWHFRVSEALAKGRDPLNAPGHSFFQKWRLKREARRADRQTAIQPELTEEIVMLATKPSAPAGQSDT